MQNQVDALLALQGLTEAERDLLDSPVAASYSTGMDTANETFRVELESGTCAYHKPITGVAVSTAGAYNHEPDETIIHEAAAWQLARLLGAPVNDLVAPCVLRTVAGQPGAFSREVPGEPWPEVDQLPDAPLYAGAFFDSLIAQQDRHLGNLLYAESEGALYLIDHGFSFACTGDLLNWSELVRVRHGRGEEALRQWERDALDHLVASEDLHGLADALAPVRALLLRARAEAMLATGSILEMGEF